MNEEVRTRSRRGLGWVALGIAAAAVAPPGWALAALFAVAATAVIARRTRALVHRRMALRRVRAGGATLLGADALGRALILDDGQLSAHGLILGASGAGKTTTLLAILSDHVRRGRPVIAIDMKGSPAFAEQLAAAAAAAGRPFRVWSLDGPSHWNPLEHGNATELKDKLICTERFTEPHYQRAAERYLQIALGVLQEVHPQRPTTLEEVVDAMDPRRLSRLTRSLSFEHRERVHDYLAELTADQLSGVRGFATRLAIIRESHSGRYLAPAPPGGGPTVDVRRAVAGSEVVLFSLNSSRYGKLAAQLGSLAIQDLVTATGDRLARGAAPQAVIGIDEFSALESDNVLNLVARGRESAVSLLLATQEMADLERAARGLSDQVTGNAAVKIAHRQDVPASAQAIAEMAGTVRVWEETRQIGGWFGRAGQSRGTRRAVERFRVHPNEIKTLRTGEAVVITKTPRASVRKIHVIPPPRGLPPKREGREL